MTLKKASSCSSKSSWHCKERGASLSSSWDWRQCRGTPLPLTSSLSGQRWWSYQNLPPKKRNRDLEHIPRTREDLDLQVDPYRRKNSCTHTHTREKKFDKQTTFTRPCTQDERKMLRKQQQHGRDPCLSSHIAPLPLIFLPCPTYAADDVNKEFKKATENITINGSGRVSDEEAVSAAKVDQHHLFSVRTLNEEGTDSENV